MSYTTCLLSKFSCILDILVVWHVRVRLFILSAENNIHFDKIVVFRLPTCMEPTSFASSASYLNHVDSSSSHYHNFDPPITILNNSSFTFAYCKPWSSLLGWNASQIHRIRRAPSPFPSIFLDTILYHRFYHHITELYVPIFKLYSDIIINE